MGEYAKTHNDPILFNPQKRGEIYRYLTYQFLHVDAKHLWINVVLLLLAGIPLELVHDGYILLAVQSAAVVLGAMFQYWVANGFMVGASAGVYAVLFLHMSNLIINGESLSPKYIVTQLILNIPLLGLMLYDLISVFTNEGKTVAFPGHLAGIFTALTLGIAILRNFNVQKWEKSVRFWLLITFGVICGMLFLVQFKDLRWNSNYNLIAAGSTNPSDLKWDFGACK